jgi:hypothetical protein
VFWGIETSVSKRFKHNFWCPSMMVKVILSTFCVYYKALAYLNKSLKYFDVDVVRVSGSVGSKNYWIRRAELYSDVVR